MAHHISVEAVQKGICFKPSVNVTALQFYYQLGASSRKNSGSNSILGSTFATELFSNFIIRVRSTTNH